jgi:hypothetical protein
MEMLSVEKVLHDRFRAESNQKVDGNTKKVF